MRTVQETEFENKRFVLLIITCIFLTISISQTILLTNLIQNANKPNNIYFHIHFQEWLLNLIQFQIHHYFG